MVISELKELKKLMLLRAKQILTLNEAALFTGLSTSHLYKQCNLKEIPFYKGNGGKLSYFDKDELIAWMRQNKVHTREEIRQEASNYAINRRRIAK